MSEVHKASVVRTRGRGRVVKSKYSSGLVQLTLSCSQQTLDATVLQQMLTLIYTITINTLQRHGVGSERALT